MHDKEQLAWLAGFIDGEGHFGCYKKGSIGFDLPQSEPAHDLCFRARDILGFGKVNGPYYTGQKKPAWRFQVSNYAEVRQLVELIRPWLGKTKLTQADAALAKFEENYGKRSRPLLSECKRGHSYLDPKNVRQNKDGSRACRACLAFLGREQRRIQREELERC